MSESPKLFALLIDGDNIQAQFVPPILNKLSEYGRTIIRKVYLNTSSTTGWQKIINEHSIEPVWIPNNTKGKNAADIALVIDAMEILYERSYITDFCVVSSDSDFTRLAKHIVGKNKFILGIGEDKTPISFISACSEFVTIEDLLKPPLPVELPAIIFDHFEQEEDKSDIIDTSQIFEMLFVQAYENTLKDDAGWAKLIEIKEVMIAQDPEFQSRDYQNTRQLAEKIKELATSYPTGVIDINEKLDVKPVIHYIRIDCDLFKFIESYKQAANREQSDWISLSSIGQEVKKYQNGFSYRGIKQLSKVAVKMSKDYPKVIELKDKIVGKSVIHFIRIKI